ncbi:MAG: GGDEF domain-containing protein [Gemmataceae bacterium]
MLRRTDMIDRFVIDWGEEQISLAGLLEKLSQEDIELLPLFKRIVLVYRRHRASETEALAEKTFHLELTETLEEDVKALDALIVAGGFDEIDPLRLPRLKDFLPVQYIESVAGSSGAFRDRQFDEKFHVLQAPHLFLPDLGYFRAKCESRDTPLAVAFIDIDDFKSLNTRHTETKVDRNLLPRFMQAIEALVFHHGYAYRQGGDEYLILLPSLSQPLAIGFLDELRRKLAGLSYPDIAERTTVSIGLCVVAPDCPLTDRELLDRANRAKQFAKAHGKNCIATYRGSRLIEQELQIATAPVSVSTGAN